MAFSGTERLRDRTTEGQKLRRDRRVGQKGRDRMAKGQKGGTERLGQKGRDRTSRIRITGSCITGHKNYFSKDKNQQDQATETLVINALFS